MNKKLIYLLWAVTFLIPSIGLSLGATVHTMKYIFTVFLASSLISAIYLIKAAKKPSSKIVSWVAAPIFGIATAASILAL